MPTKYSRAKRRKVYEEVAIVIQKAREDRAGFWQRLVLKHIARKNKIVDCHADEPNDKK